MRYRRFFTAQLFFALLSLLGFISCATSQPKSFTILHTNDMHAAFLPHEAEWIRSDPKPMVGGFEELWWTVDSLRKAKPITFFFDAGDVMTGTPISDIEYEGASGGALFAMMNDLGYDCWTIGNHDFDVSQENLKKLVHIVNFPIVSANLTDTLGQFPFLNKEYVVLQKGGVKIGIIGLMSKDLFHLTNTNNLKGLKVGDPSAVAQPLIDKITPDVDVVVALTHEGVDEDSVLAVSTHGLNIIVGGHSHTRLRVPKLVNGVIICQAGANCENLGDLDVTVEGHKVTKYDGKLIQLWARDNRPESEIGDIVKKYKAEVDKEFGRVLGTLEVDWKRGGRGETNIGDFIADAMREGTNAQIAVTNSSGIRKDLHAGKITKLDLFEISPFRNYLTTFTMTGKEVRAFAQRYAQSLMDGRSSIQISGIKCTWKRSENGAQIINLSVGGEAVDDAKTYLWTTSDFLVDQSEKYIGVKIASPEISVNTIFDALVSKVERDKSINSRIENRFQEVQ